MTLTSRQVEQCRAQFPALRRRVGGRTAVYLDGPAGTQVPTRVIDAMTRYMTGCNANHGGPFLTSLESDDWLDDAWQAAAEFVGTDDQGEIAFGQNMTSLTFALARALARTWKQGDEIIVTRLDHDANVTPWALAAADVGVTVHHVDIRDDDYTLNLADLERHLGPRTRLLAVGCASNATGGINDVRRIADLGHDAGALVFLDAVHLAPHAPIDVGGWDCDFLACSAYKFFGPHIGIQWGQRELLERLSAYKVRPAPDELPGKWMSGTQSHEAIVGTMACIDYLADLGRTISGSPSLSRRPGLERAYAAIGAHERELSRRFLQGAAEIPDLKVWGITDPARLAERVPTFSITHPRVASADLAANLGNEGFFTWHGHYYAVEFARRVGLQPDGMVRIGMLHYNTFEEVEDLLDALRRQCELKT